MYCNHCGSEVDQDSKYCRYCGRPPKSDVLEGAKKEPFNIKESLENLYFACVTVMVTLFILLAGSAIQPWPELTEMQNSVLFASLFASAFTSVSILLEKRLLVISDGLMTGGLFSLGISIIASLFFNSREFSFWIISIGMATTLYTGYIKFVKNELATAEV